MSTVRQSQAIMDAMRNRTGPLFRLRRPPTTVRWRLTLLYGGLFLVCGAALLAVTDTLVADATPVVRGAPRYVYRPGALPGAKHLVRNPIAEVVGHAVGARQRSSDLHQLVVWSAIGLVIMAVVSTLLGWVVAGRVLAPLRTITATAQEISESNLHARLAMEGPPDELRQLADTIDRLLERLEAAFAAQRRFVANASHELRTPLTGMRATLDVALAKPHVPPELRAVDAKLRKDLDQSDQLLDSFLVLARAQYGGLGAQAAVSLAQLANQTLSECSREITAKRIELRTALTPVSVAGSPILLARMVANLIDNAVSHNHTGGSIEVACDTDGSQARLTVESGGPALDEAAVARLAEPFRRLGAERTGSQSGHGLGLSIVAAVAAAHGGQLELHARAQGGLRAQVTLPVATRADPPQVSL